MFFFLPPVGGMVFANGNAPFRARNDFFAPRGEDPSRGAPPGAAAHGGFPGTQTLFSDPILLITFVLLFFSGASLPILVAPIIMWTVMSGPRPLAADELLRVVCVAMALMLFLGGGPFPFGDDYEDYDSHPAQGDSEMSSPAAAENSPAARTAELYARVRAVESGAYYDSNLFQPTSDFIFILALTSALFVFGRWDSVHRSISRTLPREWAQLWESATGFLGIRPAPLPRGQSPTSEATIAGLETVDFGTEPNGHGECSVCLDSFHPGDDAKKLVCSHVFHKDCIVPWLRQRSSCPTCRFDVESPVGPSASGTRGSSARQQGDTSSSPGNPNVLTTELSRRLTSVGQKLFGATQAVGAWVARVVSRPSPDFVNLPEYARAQPSPSPRSPTRGSPGLNFERLASNPNMPRVPVSPYAHLTTRELSELARRSNVVFEGAVERSELEQRLADAGIRG